MGFPVLILLILIDFWTNVDLPEVPRNPACECTEACDEDCFNRMLFYECNEKNCPFGAKNCGNRAFETLASDIQKGKAYAQGFEVQSYGIRGYGLRATRTYAANELIVEYCGDVISIPEMQQRMKKCYANSKHYYSLSLGQGIVIDSGIRGSVARFVNHSCSPNCEMQKWFVKGKPRVGLFSIDEISIGAELTYDYNFDWFDGAIKQTCHCGSDNCRGFIEKSTKSTRASSDSSTPPLRQPKRSARTLSKGLTLPLVKVKATSHRPIGRLIPSSLRRPVGRPRKARKSVRKQTNKSNKSKSPVSNRNNISKSSLRLSGGDTEDSFQNNDDENNDNNDNNDNSDRENFSSDSMELVRPVTRKSTLELRSDVNDSNDLTKNLRSNNHSSKKSNGIESPVKTSKRKMRTQSPLVKKTDDSLSSKQNKTKKADKSTTSTISTKKLRNRVITIRSLPSEKTSVSKPEFEAATTTTTTPAARSQSSSEGPEPQESHSPHSFTDSDEVITPTSSPLPVNDENEKRKVSQKNKTSDILEISDDEPRVADEIVAADNTVNVSESHRFFDSGSKKRHISKPNKEDINSVSKSNNSDISLIENEQDDDQLRKSQHPFSPHLLLNPPLVETSSSNLLLEAERDDSVSSNTKRIVDQLLPSSPDSQEKSVTNDQQTVEPNNFSEQLQSNLNHETGALNHLTYNHIPSQPLRTLKIQSLLTSNDTPVPTKKIKISSMINSAPTTPDNTNEESQFSVLQLEQPRIVYPNNNSLRSLQSPTISTRPNGNELSPNFLTHHVYQSHEPRIGAFNSDSATSLSISSSNNITHPWEQSISVTSLVNTPSVYPKQNSISSIINENPPTNRGSSRYNYSSLKSQSINKPKRGRPPNSTRLSLTSLHPIAPLVTSASRNNVSSQSKSSRFEPFNNQIQSLANRITPNLVTKPRRGRPPNSAPAHRNTLTPLAVRPSPRFSAPVSFGVNRFRPPNINNIQSPLNSLSKTKQPELVKPSRHDSPKLTVDDAVKAALGPVSKRMNHKLLRKIREPDDGDPTKKRKRGRPRIRPGTREQVDG